MTGDRFRSPGRPMTTSSHKLVLPSDANHHGTLYAGAMLRFVLEAGYATAWKHIGPRPTWCCAGC